ncbi:MAG TPA: outer membrane lipoprotein carrier protein LolA [Anaeromyxobacter sp.]
MLALLLSAALAATPARLGPDALRARYAGIRALSADVVQVKEGRFWARPLESRIRLTYTPERITWETVAPVRSTVTIAGDRLVVADASGKTRELGALAGDPRVVALLGFIRALVAVDLEAIERDFTLRYGDGEVVATPRPGARLALFERIRLRFDAHDDLTGMELVTATERTRLSFRNVARTPPPPGAAPGASR